MECQLAGMWELPTLPWFKKTMILHRGLQGAPKLLEQLFPQRLDRPFLIV
jgi:hypothetical protein